MPFERGASVCSHALILPFSVIECKASCRGNDCKNKLPAMIRFQAFFIIRFEADSCFATHMHADDSADSAS